MLPSDWRKNIVTLAQLPRLSDAIRRPLQLVGMVILRIRRGNPHFHAHFIITKHVDATMIIGIESLDCHGREMRCLQRPVEKTRGTVRILGRNKATVKVAKTDVNASRPPNPKIPDPVKEALSRSSTRTTQKICVPSITLVPVLVRYHLRELVNTDPKHSLFFNHRLKITNGIH